MADIDSNPGATNQLPQLPLPLPAEPEEQQAQEVWPPQDRDKEDANLAAATMRTARQTQVPRLPDWQERFTDYLRECRREGVKLDWEFMDCAKYSSGGTEAVIGYNLYEALGFDQVEPRTAPAMYRALREKGYENIVDFMDAHFARRPLAYIQRGDVVLVPIELGQAAEMERLGFPYALALADPPLYWGISSNGFGNGPLTDAAIAFQVGE